MVVLVAVSGRGHLTQVTTLRSFSDFSQPEAGVGAAVAPSEKADTEGVKLVGGVHSPQTSRNQKAGSAQRSASSAYY